MFRCVAPGGVVSGVVMATSSTPVIGHGARCAGSRFIQEGIEPAAQERVRDLLGRGRYTVRCRNRTAHDSGVHLGDQPERIGYT